MSHSRRDFIKIAGLGAGGALMAPGIAGQTASQKRNLNNSANKPNILIIMTDQHRFDLMSNLGNSIVPTPNIDRIAAKGVSLNRSYCPYPVCVSSRMAFLTGLYGHTTGAITNADSLDWRYKTMAHHFAENGYLTSLIGKMHFMDVHNHGFEYYMSINDWLMYLGPKVPLYANEVASHYSTDHFFNHMDDNGAGFPDVHDLWKGKSPWVGQVQKLDLLNPASKIEAEDHLDSFIARETVKFLKRYRDQPFFMISSFMNPHTPLFAPKEYADKYPVDKIRLPEIGDISKYPDHIKGRITNLNNSIDKQVLKASRAGYYACLEFVDHCIGLVYDELENLGILDNTIVVYTTDHGEMNGDHGMYGKFTLFDPAARVPLIVSYPKKLGEGAISEALTEHFGLYPTLCDLADIEQPKTTYINKFEGAPEKMDAKSFINSLNNPESKGPEAAFCEIDQRSKHPKYMIRTDQYKFIYNEGLTNELYDLEKDPGEFNNLAGSKKLIKKEAELKDQLFSWFNPEDNKFKNTI